MAQHIDEKRGELKGETVMKQWLVMSFNALTLKSNEQKKLLAKQLQDRGVLLAGIQEGRAKATEIRMYGDFLVVRAKANDAGSYGCELWLSTKVAMGKVSDETVTITRQAVYIVMAR